MAYTDCGLLVGWGSKDDDPRVELRDRGMGTTSGLLVYWDSVELDPRVVSEGRGIGPTSDLGESLGRDLDRGRG